MSEYQYYEFRSIDRPLSKADQAHLRSISSRGDITSTSFTNEYQWGDFKGNPLNLMHRCFDFHVYYANWGSRTLMLRLPADAIPTKAMTAYKAESMSFDRKDDHVVLNFGISPDDGFDQKFDLYDASWADDLLPIRELLLNDDMRPLYLGWLAGIHDVRKETALEPPLPPGLNELPDALESLVSFLGIDEDLLAVAAELSPAIAGAKAADDDPAQWIATLPAVEKDVYIVQLFNGQSVAARSALQASYRRHSRKADAGRGEIATGRTIEDLIRLSDAMRDEKTKAKAAKAKQAAEQRALAAAKERQEHLKSIAKQFDATWTKVESEVQMGVAHYPAVATLLQDLREAAPLASREADFARRFHSIVSKFARRPALLECLRKKNLMPRSGIGA